jgi:DNA (cytosine-5)-methyltransferase 1
MRYLSVCSGIEAATVAWEPLGWKPAGFSEIDKFPSAVLDHHYPNVRNHGDFTTIKADDVGPIDLLVGGTPCQSFSIAGLRGGLADDRGNLALEFLRLAERTRPRWLVWENVPGVLSSNGGRDFGSILGGMVELRYGFFYRVVDAQYFGLAQRRKRVLVVGYLGDWRPAAAVFLERESLSWNPPPRRKARKDLAPTISARTKGGGGLGTDFDCDGGLIASTGNVAHCLNAGGMGRIDYESETLITHALRGEGFDASEDGTGRGTPLVPVPIQSVQAVREKRQNGIGIGQAGDAMFTLTGRDRHAVAFSCKDHGADAGDLAPTLRAMGHDGSHANAGGQIAVAFRTTGNDGAYELGDQSGCLGTNTGPNAQVLVSKNNETLYPVGVSQQENGHASTQETHAGTLLRAVREALGEEAFTQWGLGILDTLQPQEILRQALHGCELRPTAFSRRWVVYCALPREKDRAAGAVQSMREAESEGRSPQRWKPSEQRSRELGAYLSELSQPGAQAERFMRDLWQASEGLGILRQALSAVQEARRPTSREGQSAHQDSTVRRLTVEECEFLQGFPRGYTAIPYRKGWAADGPRYKALGNSMAVPCMAWTGSRIQQVEAILSSTKGGVNV